MFELTNFILYSKLNEIKLKIKNLKFKIKKQTNKLGVGTSDKHQHELFRYLDPTVNVSVNVNKNINKNINININMNIDTENV